MLNTCVCVCVCVCGWLALRYCVGDAAVTWQQSMLSLFSPNCGTPHSRSLKLCLKLSYLFQHSLSRTLTPTCWIVMPTHTHTHTFNIDRLPEDTRSSRTVSIFKAALSTGDLYHNLINMGVCSAQILSWHRERPTWKNEEDCIPTHKQHTHTHTHNTLSHAESCWNTQGNERIHSM